MSEDLAIPKLGPVIAIDGPAGTGKSSVTRRLADLLNFVHVDTGALYRAIAWMSIQELEQASGSPAAADEVNPERAADIARTIHLEFKRNPKKNPSNRIFANGKDITNFIRTPEVSMLASRVSAIPAVRASLLGLQRRLGCGGRSILEGRDIGTVVFPDADVKFFLNASVDERAKRRLIELEASGADPISFEEIRRQIAERDLADSTRAIAPLKRAPDAVEVDTTQLALDEVVKKLESIIREKGIR